MVYFPGLSNTENHSLFNLFTSFLGENTRKEGMKQTFRKERDLKKAGDLPQTRG